MSIQIPGSIPEALPTVAAADTPRPAEAEAANAFSRAMQTPAEGEPERVVTDEELQKAIGDSIMFKIINDTFDNLRKYKESLR